MLISRLSTVIATIAAIFSASLFVTLPAASAATKTTHRTQCASTARSHAKSKACKASARKPAPKPKPKPKPVAPTTHAHTTAPAPTPTTPAPTPAPAPAPAPAPVASTAPCANGDLMPDATNIAVVEASTLCLVNQVRGQHGLPALVENTDLQASADQHNNDMVNADYFAHNGPGGDTPLSRIQATGYLADPNASYVIGENIAWGTLNLATPNSIVTAWVNSPEHLANILNASYTDTGMSISSSAPSSLAEGQQGSVYTEDFGGVDNSGN
jgi:uncharacterized protein YkwD